MFGVSPAEKCILSSAKWYDDKGFIRVSFRAGSEYLPLFISISGGDNYDQILVKVTKNLCYVFDVNPPDVPLSKWEYLPWLALQLEKKIGQECVVKVGLAESGRKFILSPKYEFSPFIDKTEGPSRLKYTKEQKKRYGNPEKLKKVEDFPTAEDMPMKNDQSLYYEDFNSPDF